MKNITTLAEAKCASVRVVQLERLMDRAQANPQAWKRTMGCPGSRYLPEWELLMSKLTRWMDRANEYALDIWAEYEAELRK